MDKCYYYTTYQAFSCLFLWSVSLLFCVYHSPSVSCFTELFLVSVSYFSLSLVFSCCLVVWFLILCLVSWINPFAFLLDSVCPCLDHCSCTWITPLVKPSGYCSPIEDHARLLEYSFVLPSIYLFAICSTLPVFLTMSINKSLHMDPHASRLVGSVTLFRQTLVYN